MRDARQLVEPDRRLSARWWPVEEELNGSKIWRVGCGGGVSGGWEGGMDGTCGFGLSREAQEVGFGQWISKY